MRFLRPANQPGPPAAGTGWLRGNVIIAGDSLLNTNLGVLQSWQRIGEQAIKTLGASLTLRETFNIAADGMQIATMAGAPYLATMLALFYAPGGPYPVRLMQGGWGNAILGDGGVNDAYNGALSPAIIANLKTFHNAIRTAGGTSSIMTLTPNNNPGRAGTFDQAIAEVNADIRANLPLYGARSIFDAAACPQAMDPTNMSYYQAPPNYGHYTLALANILGVSYAAPALSAAILAP